MLTPHVVRYRTFREPRSAARVMALLIAAAGVTTPALAQDWHWNAGDGDWSSAASWLPFSPPPAHANVFIGSAAAAENAVVEMDINAAIANLVITDGMQLDTRLQTLTVGGHTVVSGANYIGWAGVWSRSRLVLGSKDGLSFSSHDLTVSDGAEVHLDGGVGHISGQLLVNAGTFLSGDGILGFSGTGSTLINNGRIDPGVAGGLILQQSGGGRYDLDGTTGEGIVDMFGFGGVTQQGTSLRLSGAGLSDAFSGEITLGPDSDLFMNLTEGWVSDSSSEIRMSGILGHSQLPAVIRGSELDFSGRLLVTGPAGGVDAGRVEVRSSRITLGSPTRVEVNEGARLTLGGESTLLVLVKGGTYDIAHAGLVRFEAPTEIRGGTFTTASSQPADGAVEFMAPTTYNGEVAFNGFARQAGDAEVPGSTTINADRFYMSVSDQTDWVITAPLTINADFIGAGASTFRGEMRIGASLGRFTTNLASGSGQWTMRGDLILTGDAGFFTTRVAGDDLYLEGSLTVPAGRAQITADTFFGDGSSVNISGAASHLRMAGYTDIHAGSLFSGQGTLHNGLTGTMVLRDGVTLNDIGLINQGSLSIAFEDGVASVARFTNTEDGTLNVTIAGYATGVEHDMLLVSDGPAMLGGKLQVSTLQVGLDGLLPRIGDEFTIITAVGGVSGVFLNDPVSVVGAYTYDWAVVYNTDSVVLRLEKIVPAPGSLALLTLAGLIATRRQREQGRAAVSRSHTR